NARATFADIERSGLAACLDQPAQLGPDRAAEIEPRAIDRSQPPQRRSEPEDAILLANEIAASLERGGKTKERTFVETGCHGDLAERHRRPMGMECIETREGAFHRLDLVVAHGIGEPQGFVSMSSILERYCAVQNVVLIRTLFYRAERNGRSSGGHAGARSDQRARWAFLLLSAGPAGRRGHQSRGARLRRSGAPTRR